MDIRLLVEIASLAIGAAVALGGLVAVLRSTALRNSVELLRAEKDDLRSMVETLQMWKEDAGRRIASLERENAVLREEVTNAAAVAELTRMVAENHRALLSRLDELTGERA